MSREALFILILHYALMFYQVWQELWPLLSRLLIWMRWSVILRTQDKNAGESDRCLLRLLLALFFLHLSYLSLCVQEIKYNILQKMSWKEATCCVFRSEMSKHSSTICTNPCRRSAHRITPDPLGSSGTRPVASWMLQYMFSFVLETPVSPRHPTCEGLHRFFFFLKTIIKEESCVFFQY